MSTEKFIINYHKYQLDSLSDIDAKLVSLATEACKTSFSPYSNFKVGAAALLETGEIMVSSNQESEVFPSGICAERSLLYYLQANRKGIKVTALAITSDPQERECYPCGACRQVIVDTEKRQITPIRVIMCGNKTASVLDSAMLLLPFTFEL